MERAELGRTRHLIAAATGTGKTMIAAFDYRKREFLSIWCPVALCQNIDTLKEFVHIHTGTIEGGNEMKQIRVSSASLVLGLLIATTTSQQQVLASTDDGLRWTMSELVIHAQVTSMAAVGATKDGAIVARGLIGGALQVCVWLPVSQSVGDDLTIVANIRSGSDTYRVALLSDARADHRPTGTVDVEDLIQYVIDYADQKPAADMDASGAVTCSDCEEYVEVWFAAQAAPPQPPATVDALALHALLTRVLIPGDVPQGLRSAAREQYEDAIAQLAAAVGGSAPTAQPADDCAHVPYDENSSRNWCGTESFNAPDLFPACCAKHDNCYRGRPVPNPLPPDPELPALAPAGGREGCDDQFLDCMLKACETDHGCLIARFGCKLAAGAYHLGVRWFGNKPYCECLEIQDPNECGSPAVANQLGLHASVVLP